MDWFTAPDSWLARLVLQRALACCYLVAFVACARQFVPLLGERGLTPAVDFVRRVSFRAAPSLFHWRCTDRFVVGCAWAGAALAAAVALGAADAVPWPAAMAMWLVLWALYLSIVNVGRVWYGYGWETLLLEAGFLAIFLGNARTAPPALVLWLLRWLAFRVEFGAGLIKWRGDRCWRELTCLDYHHETQPLPGPFSWHFHRLPRRLHRVETVANHLAQLVVPFGLLCPQPVATVAALVIAATQLWLVVSGNYAWLNWLTLIIVLSAVDFPLLGAPAPPAAADAAPPVAYVAVVGAVTVLVLVLSWRPARNLVSRSQRMNASFDALHLVNTYGAFGSVTRMRHEIVIEGTEDTELGDGTRWREYEFPGKPGAVRRRPRQFAPYQLRLDWQLWFAALSPAYARGWFEPLVQRLLAADPATLRLLAHDPFEGRRPPYVRALYYRYRFTTRAERRASGAWWHRDLQRVYLPPVAGPGPDGAAEDLTVR